jgi:hypothetical protein
MKNSRLKSETKQDHEKIHMELRPFKLTLNDVPSVTEMEDLHVVRLPTKFCHRET